VRGLEIHGAPERDIEFVVPGSAGHVRHAVSRELVTPATVLRPYLNYQAWPSSKRSRDIVYVDWLRPDCLPIGVAHAHVRLPALAHDGIIIRVHRRRLARVIVVPCAICVSNII
jgi:hypothetical protein